jgi:hypothetical protein
MPGCGTGSSKGDKQDGDLRQSPSGKLNHQPPGRDDALAQAPGIHRSRPLVLSEALLN